MKKLLAFALMTLSISSFAYDLEPHYYATEFKVVSVRPRGLGSLVTLETGLNGCLDDFLFSDFEARKDGRGGVELYAVGVAKMNPKSLAAYCVRMPTVRKTVEVTFPGTITVINQRIEQ